MIGISLKKLFFNVGFIFLLFQNLLFTNFSLPDFVTYWDELLFFIFVIFYIIHIAINRGTIQVDRGEWKILVFIVLITAIGLSGNLYFGYMDSWIAILRDVVNFVKFPLTFFILKNLKLDKKIAKNISIGCMTFLKITIMIIFVLGIVSLFKDIGLSQNEIRAEIHPYQFLFSHPTHLVLNHICLLAILNADEKKNNVVYYILIMVNIFLTMRTKGIALIAVFIFIKYVGKWMKRYQIIYWAGIFSVVVIMGYNKLLLYISFSSSPREEMYKGAFQLLKECFPLGSGFATYASHLSGNFHSLVYQKILVQQVWVDGQQTAVLGDAGYCYYIGQFGLFGSLFFCLILYYIYRNNKKINGNQNLSAMIILLYIGIALTSESVLQNNGVDLAIVLATVSNTIMTKTDLLGKKKVTTLKREGTQFG